MQFASSPFCPYECGGPVLAHLANAHSTIMMVQK